MSKSSLLPDQTIKAKLAVLGPAIVSTLVAVDYFNRSKAALQLVVVTKALQDPMDAMIWEKESESAYQIVLRHIVFDSIGIAIAGVLLGLIMHHLLYSILITKAAKKIPMPSQLPPTSSASLASEGFQSYIRVYQEMVATANQDARLTNVDFSRMAVGSRQFSYTRSWPVWLKAYPKSKYTLGLSALAYLILFPKPFFITAGVLVASILGMEFLLKTRGYFETEARKFISPGRVDTNHVDGRTPYRPPETDIANQISKLHGLMKSGAITQDEFDEQKKRLFKNAA